MPAKVSVSAGELQEATTIHRTIVQAERDIESTTNKLEQLRKAKDEAVASLQKRLAAMPKEVRDLFSLIDGQEEGGNGRAPRVPYDEKVKIVTAILKDHKGKMPYLDLRKEYERRTDGANTVQFKPFLVKAKKVFKITGKGRKMVVSFRV